MRHHSIHVPPIFKVDKGAVAADALELAIFVRRVLHRHMVPQDLISLILLTADRTVCRFVGPPTAIFAEKTVI